MARTALLILAALAAPIIVGCDSPSASSGGSPSSSAAASSTTFVAAPPPPAQPPPPAPDDLELAPLQKALKCPVDSKSGPCRVLASFSACKEWSANPPSGDGRWLGRGFVVEGGKTSEQVTMLRSKRAPTVEIGPGQLPVKIAITELGKEEGVPYDQAERTIRIFERNDIPPRSNATIEYIKKRTEWVDAHATRTAGGQVLVNTQGGAFICQGAKQQLIVVQRSTTAGATGDGLYAELWATTW